MSVSQPIAATVTNAMPALRWLGHQPPELEEVRWALDQIIKDGHRAGEVIGRIRALIRKVPPAARFIWTINEAILDVHRGPHSPTSLRGKDASLRTRLRRACFRSIRGDRIVKAAASHPQLDHERRPRQ